MKTPKPDNTYNNFDIIRTLLAIIVVFYHLYALSLISHIAWFSSVFNADFAVKGFFAISGYLVLGSFISSKNNGEFFEKRYRRIYPAYFSAILLCLFIGLCTTSHLGDFISSPHVLKYIFANLSFLNSLQPSLPGVFESNPMRAMDGALWTIKVEICLYLCIPFIYFLFRQFNEYAVALLLIFLSLLWLYFFKEVYKGIHGIEMAKQAPGQLSYFVIGAFLYVNNRIYKALKFYVLAFAAFYFLARNYPFQFIIEPFFYSTLVIYLSTQAVKNLNFGRVGDLSYGIYLYHFPIIQLLIWGNVFNENIYLGVAMTFVIVISLSLMSWHFIEKRFLKRNSNYVVEGENAVLPTGYSQLSITGEPQNDTSS
jgi:peptidoglycan/LPS O-acetylase OafA/YrhL